MRYIIKFMHDLFNLYQNENQYFKHGLHGNIFSAMEPARLSFHLE